MQKSILFAYSYSLICVFFSSSERTVDFKATYSDPLLLLLRLVSSTYSLINWFCLTVNFSYRRMVLWFAFCVQFLLTLAKRCSDLWRERAGSLTFLNARTASFFIHLVAVVQTKSQTGIFHANEMGKVNESSKREATERKKNSKKFKLLSWEVFFSNVIFYPHGIQLEWELNKFRIKTKYV